MGLSIQSTVWLHDDANDRPVTCGWASVFSYNTLVDEISHLDLIDTRDAGIGLWLHGDAKHRAVTCAQVPVPCGCARVHSTRARVHRMPLLADDIAEVDPQGDGRQAATDSKKTGPVERRRWDLAGKACHVCSLYSPCLRHAHLLHRLRAHLGHRLQPRR